MVFHFFERSSESQLSLSLISRLFQAVHAVQAKQKLIILHFKNYNTTLLSKVLVICIIDFIYHMKRSEVSRLWLALREMMMNVWFTELIS